jgi:hypothetical protein
MWHRYRLFFVCRIAVTFSPIYRRINGFIYTTSCRRWETITFFRHSYVKAAGASLLMSTHIIHLVL